MNTGLTDDPIVTCRILMGLMLPTWFLSLWICNLAAVGLTIPIANAIIEQLKGSDRLHKITGITRFRDK